MSSEAAETAGSTVPSDSLRPLRLRLSPRTWQAIGVGAFFTNVALQVIGLGLLPWLAGSDIDAAAADVVVAVPTFLLLSAVGALILIKVPGHPIGVLFAVAPLMMMSANAAQSYITATDPELPARDWVGAIVSPVWLLGTVSLATFLPLLFPNGAYLSPRWRWVGRFTALVIVLTYVCYLLAPGQVLDQDVVIDNPLGVAGLGDVLETGRVATGVLIQVAVILSLVSLGLRFRRSEGVERQQLKWFLAALCLAVAFFLVLGPLLGLLGIETPDAAYLFAIALLPLSVAVAISRYRLYEIDYLINRAFVYASLTAVLAGVLAACLSLFSILFEGIAGGSDAQVVVTALILTTVFAPVKRELQGFADKRFGVQDQSELEAFQQRLAQVIQVIDPAASSRELLDRAVHSLKAEGGAVFLYRDGLAFCTAIHGQFDEDDCERFAIAHEGEELGYVILCRRKGGPTPSEQELAALDETTRLMGHVLSLNRTGANRVPAPSAPTGGGG